MKFKKISFFPESSLDKIYVNMIALFLIIWIIIQGCFLLEKYGEIQIWPRLEAYIEEQLFSKIIDRYNR